MHAAPVRVHSSLYYQYTIFLPKLYNLLVKNILLGLPDGTSEIMTHPGADNVLLAQNFKWGYHWHDELNAFLSESNKNIAREQGIELINFGRL